MEPETKKRKFIRPPPRRSAPSTPVPSDPPIVNMVQSVADPRIQHAKNQAIAQAQQDGSKANFKIFDSPFGNFLVPVVPTLEELGLSS